MHTKYHTEAFIVRSFERGEADRVHVLITRELGKVYARAKSVRRLASKHRFGLQTFSQSTVSLVRGKTGMRIVHVAPVQNAYRMLAPYPQNLDVLKKVFSLAERLTPQDEPATEVFAILVATVRALIEETDPRRIRAIEAGAALGILYALGYVRHTSPFADIAEGAMTMSAEYAEKVAESRQLVVREINRALSASQL